MKDLLLALLQIMLDLKTAVLKVTTDSAEVNAHVAELQARVEAMENANVLADAEVAKLIAEVTGTTPAPPVDGTGFEPVPVVTQ